MNIEISHMALLVFALEGGGRGRCFWVKIWGITAESIFYSSCNGCKLLDSIDISRWIILSKANYSSPPSPPFITTPHIGLPTGFLFH